MRKRPETIFYDYKYDCDTTDVIAMDDEPTNAKFWTESPDTWFKSSLTYYNRQYDTGILKNKPEVRFPARGQIGKQIIVPDNRNPDEDCYVTLFFYKTGVIVIQGRGCGEWEEKDMMDIKYVVRTINKSTASLDSCISPTDMSEGATSVTENNTASLIHATKPATHPSLADRLYKAASFLIPRSNSTPKNNQSVNSSKKLTTLSPQPADDSDVACSDLTKCSEDLCLETNSSQQLLFEMDSRNSDMDESSADEREIITTPSEMHSSPQLGLPQPPRPQLVNDKLLDAERTISILTKEIEQLQTNNEHLNAEKTTLQARCDELNTDKQILQAQLLSLKRHDKNTDSFVARPPVPTPNSDKDILIVGTSMVRGLATELNRSHRVKATGYIYPGGTTKRLIDSLPGTQPDNKHYKPHFVIVDAGTNDVSAGTTAGKIANEVNELMNVAKDTYPSAEICYSSIHHRNDISHVNRTIDTINHKVKEFCNTQNFRFIDNGTDASDPHTTRLNKSGLHLNSKGKRDVADRIITTCLSNGQGARPRKLITNTTVKPQRPTRSAHPHYSRRPMRDKPSIPALMDLSMIPPQQRRPRCPPHGLWMCCPQVNMPHH